MVWDFSGSIVVLGDCHFPFSCRNSVNRAIDYIQNTQPKVVVQVGDLYDMFSQTKFPKRLSITPRSEKELARHDADLMWSLIRKVVPFAKLFQLTGNHDVRAHKRLIEKLPELEPFTNFESHWDFIEWGVETIYDPRQDLELAGIVFTHGHFSRLGQHLTQVDYKNVVHGHTHRGGVHFQRLKSGRIAWELDVGYLGDPFHESMLYRPLTRFFGWTHGIGVIDSLGPRFIPF
jgi:predicted phosphodiesterase